MGYSDPAKQRAYAREWMRKRRAAFFDGKQCVRCGSTERLELDHVDPLQKTTHCVWSWSQKRRDEELAKCQVLCHDCHFAKTASELPFMGPYLKFAGNVTAHVTSANAVHKVSA